MLNILHDLDVCMVLRKPQLEALTAFAKALDLLKWEKVPWIPQADRSESGSKYTSEQLAEADRVHNAELESRLHSVREKFPTLTSFEREFPSLCFALATGVGKTRLMAATMAYLHRVKKVNNFFVVAPNKTIYEKLKRDFDPQFFHKYVFTGLYDFVQPPQIIDGDNFENFRQSLFRESGLHGVTINIFNIAKLTHGRGKDAEMARVQRLNEVLGQSYFDYLRSLPDLCLMMDESHHYHAEQGFGALNDLNPMLGLEFTATPQIQTTKGKVNFKNVIYEYSLAHALNDKMYVKEPVAWTRKDFDPSQFKDDQSDKLGPLEREKLVDGIKLHIDTKAKLDVYGRNHGLPIVKPFVLVVARDIPHSRQIRDFLTSDEFCEGYYRDKVIEIHSGQGKVESDENTEKLLGLEDRDNQTEIVIHVNKLKEGWDVTNLYTIIPLRASASETLTEQTIGRGLRLPYGKRTGDDEIDRLHIVSHDRYSEIIALANRPDSLVRRVYHIDPSIIPDAKPDTEPVEFVPTYNTRTSSPNFVAEISTALGNKVPQEARDQVAKFVAERASHHVMGMSRIVKHFEDVRTNQGAKDAIKDSIIKETKERFPDVQIAAVDLGKATEAAIENCAEALTGTIIPIPEAIISPLINYDYRFEDFDLDTRGLSLRPADDALIGQELSEGGRLVEFEGEDMELLAKKQDTPEKEVVKFIAAKPDIDYHRWSKLIFSLVRQAKTHFLLYLSSDDTDKLMMQQPRIIANFIYAQMQEHFVENKVEYGTTEMRPFSRIETSFGSKVKADSIYDFNTTVSAGEVRQRVFKGFAKACHTLYKFDSLAELNFARVLERDNDPQKWMRPAPKQFNIYWGRQGQRYEPDFIVETADKLYMLEVKAANEIHTPEVQEKGRAAEKYCREVSEWNHNNGGKPWEYAIIADSSIMANSSFQYLIGTKTPLKNMME
jgi:type III restriction enzyme